MAAPPRRASPGAYPDGRQRVVWAALADAGRLDDEVPSEVCGIAERAEVAVGRSPRCDGWARDVLARDQEHARGR